MQTTLSRLMSHKDSVFLLIATLFTLLLGNTVYADTPTQGGGNFFDLIDTPIEDNQVVGSNTISVRMLTADTNGTLNGTVSTEVTCVVKTLTQKGICQGMTTFEGDVEGAEGTLVINNEFRVDGSNLEAGSFAILSGTDELASLQGEGTFSGSFATANGTYTMVFHFHPEGEEIGAQVQTYGSGCTLLRPLSWNVYGVTCLEGATTSIPLADGQAYTAIGIPWGIFGEGYTRVRCNNGRISTEAKVCRRWFGPLP